MIPNPSFWTDIFMPGIFSTPVPSASVRYAVPGAAAEPPGSTRTYCRGGQGRSIRPSSWTYSYVQVQTSSSSSLNKIQSRTTRRSQRMSSNVGHLLQLYFSVQSPVMSYTRSCILHPKWLMTESYTMTTSGSPTHVLKRSCNIFANQ